jgi:PAS domain S-box-containing protein
MTVGTSPVLVRSEGDPATLSEDLIGVFSAMAQPVLVTDADFDLPGPGIVFVNAAFEAMSGYAAAEVIGRSPRLLQGPATDHTIFAPLRDRLETDGCWDGRTVNYRKDGRPYVVEWSISPIRSASGQVTNYLAIQRNVTAEEETKETNRENEALVGQLLAHADDAVIAVDRAQRIVVANPAVERVFGWSAGELLGRPLAVLLPERVRQNHRAWFTRYAEESLQGKLMGQRGEIVGRRRDGTEFPAEASIFAARLERRTVFATILRDVSERKARETELRESRRRFRALFDLSYQFVGLLSADGRLLEANQAAMAFIGERIEAVRGLPFEATPWFSGSEDARAKVREALRRAQTGTFVRDQISLVARDGTPRVFDFSLRPVLGEDGRILHFIPEGRDITDLAQANEALRRSERHLINAQRIANVGNWHLTVATGEIVWSDQVFSIFGIEPNSSRAFDGRFLDLVHPDDRGALTSAVEAALDGRQPYDLVHRIVRPDGTIRVVRQVAEVSRDPDGRPSVMEGVVQDITEAHEAETKLIEAYNQARDASEAKTQFLATMSHELRTPLNAIIGFSEMLEGEVFGPLGDAQYAEYARHVLDSGRHLLSLVNDVLDISRIAAREFPLDLRSIDPATVAREALPMIAARADAKSLKLENQIRPGRSALRADPRALRQILLNGLSNAVKFTPSGGTVRLSARVGKDGSIVLRIIDTGIGIPSDALPDLAQPFHRATGPAHVSDHDGIGLGLAIVAGLVRLMDGSMRLRSREGVGTCLEVRLPAAPSGFTT